MKEIFIDEYTLPEAYHNALRALRLNGDGVLCPDWNTKQIELSMTFTVQKPLEEPMISKMFIGGPRELEQYRQEMLDGILDFEIEKGNWAYTYHDRIVKQLPWLISELKRNPDTRRAVIVVRDWERDSQSEDPACLQHIQYFIRKGALDCQVLFRSNDACKATFMNAFALIMLQKRIADKLGVRVGTYTHRANSFHCYEKDYDLLKGYVNRIETAYNKYNYYYHQKNDERTKMLEELAYYYDGDWKETMEEYQPEIAEMVEELRGN